MLDSRAKKIFRDLLSNKFRTLLVIIAIAIGVFAFGSVFITQEMILKNLQHEFKLTNPSSITLYLDEFEPSLVSWVSQQEGVGQAAAKTTLNTQLINDGGIKTSLNIYAYSDYEKLKLNLLQPISGSWPPKKKEIILERNSFNSGNFTRGDDLNLELSDGQDVSLKLAGVVYDNSAIPFTFTNQMTGFISWETLGYIGLPKKFNTIDIKTDESITDLEDGERLTFDLTEKLKNKGVNVRGSMVFPPNEHWAEDNSKAFTAILSTIGIFSLLLSGFLVINTVSAILTQQKKQIGVMRAIGGRQVQITSLYVATVLAYGTLALLFALPIGMGLAYIFLRLIGSFLNMDFDIFYLPVQVGLMQLAAAVAIPVVAAIYPILQSAKSPVNVSLSDYRPARKLGKFELFLIRLRGLPRPVLISFRNVFRKKGRLVLTLGTLVVAGAVFISVINVRSGMYLELERILQMFDFEVSLNLSESYNVESVEKRIKEIEQVKAVEARNGIGARRIKEDNSKGAAFGISGLPPQTIFSHPVILSGRWLIDGDKDNIVLSSSYIRDNPDLSVGDTIKVSYGDNEEKVLAIVGIIAMSGDQKIGFMEFSRVAVMNKKKRQASSYLLKTSPKDSITQNEVAKAVTDRLEASGIDVAGTETRNSIFASAANQFNFLIFFLLTMAVMIAAVGGLGLAGTMSLNVMERTREIGIMRSLGAGDSVIREVVLIEGVFVGIVSFLLALPLSIPITYGLCYAIGNAFFERVLVFDFVPMGALIWLMIIFIIAVIASLFPARRATNISIRETLAYE